MKLFTRAHRKFLFALLLCGVGLLALRLNWHAGATAQGDQPGQASTDGVWQGIGTRQAEGLSRPTAAFRLNQSALTAVLDHAPLEFTAAAKNAPTLTLPLPDGSFERFRIEESPLMEPALAARFPEIKTFSAQSVDAPGVTGRLTWSPRGFYAFILRGAGAVSVQLANTGDTTIYVSYASQDQPADTQQLRCLVDEKEQARATRLAPDAPAASVGGTLRVYRVAIATTVEYTNQANLGGGTVGGAITSIGVWLSGINAIMEKEVAVRLVLVGNNNLVIFTAEPDGFTNSNEQTMLDQAPNVLNNNIGVNNFDIGHVFGTAPSGGAGIAGLGVLCDNTDFGNGPQKGSGATRFSGPSGQSGQLGVIAHEFGHEFGASHTFNALEASGNCAADNRSGVTAYETGSGSTLMSYGGICNTNNLSGKEFRLHAGSFGQIIPVLNNATCNMANWIATTNNVPTINAGGNFTIPAQTPFQLTASGSDPDTADLPNLTYTWDQMDAGGALYPNPPYGDQPGDPNTTTRPLFRSYPASSNPARLFPSLTYILNNANVPPAQVGGFITGENPPSVSRTMNFRATVRDNRSNGGGVNESTAIITVAGNAGPFNVTVPNGGENITGGVATNVTWNVAGTNGAPINAANVKISLSTDGGNTFPTVLAASTPNDGNQSVTFPNGLVSTTARLKIEAVGNIFFDISDNNFNLTPGDGCQAVSSFAPSVSSAGGQVVLTGINFTGVTAVNFTGANVSCPSANCTVNSNTQITLTVPAGAMTGPLTVVKPGCTNLTTATLIVCPNAAVTLQVDDGTVNTRANNGNPAYYVNRLTPAAYPATLSQVLIFFPGAGSGFNPVTSVLPTTPITVVFGGNTSGSPDNTVFQTLDTTVGALDTFRAYQLPTSVTIASGDFIVGFIANTPGLFPIAIDNSSNGNRSFTSTNGTSFNAITGNYMIRAQVFTGNCGGAAPACPTVTNINPTNGAVGASVVITGTNFAGVTGVKFSNNVTATFNVDSATQITATVPAGAVTGPITISKTGCTDVQTATFTVNAGCPTITLTAPPLPVGTVNTAYNQTLTASGGTGPYTFTLVTGSPVTTRFDASGPVNIPDNNPTGADLPVTVSGITSPITKVTVSLQITHTFDRDLKLQLIGPDATTIDLAVNRGPNGATTGYGTACNPDTSRTTFDDAAVTLIANGVPPFTGTFKPDQLLAGFNGKTGAAANGQWKLHAIDNAGDDTGTINCVSISITQTQLAPGLSLAANGTISGTPTTTGTYNFTVKATDAGNCMGMQAYVLTINGGCPTITVNPSNPTLTAGTVGTAYTQTFTQTNGVGTILWSISAGTLPAGLTLDSGTGVLSGNPTTAATSTFTIQAKDANNCTGSRQYMLTVNPNGGPTGLQFYPLARPVRLLDTRAGQGNCDNIGTPITGGSSLTTLARVTCEGIIIPSTAQAVVGNITVVNGSGQSGFLTLYPAGQQLPLAANLIYSPGDILSNAFTVGLNASGQFNIYGERTIDVIVDISGYYAPPLPAGLYYHPLSKPVRLLDTRAGQGNCDSVSTPIAGGSSLTTLARVTCEGVTIPAAAQAIVGNATVINGSGQTGYLTIYPNGVPAPLAANIIYFPGQVISNSFTVSLSASGEFNIFGERTIDMAIDVAGYYSNEANDANGTGLQFTPLSRPLRILDTRAGQGNCDNIGAPIVGGASIAAPARLTCESITIPATAQTVIGIVTVVNRTGQLGFMTMYPDGVAQPLAANMIYFPNQVLSNAFVVGLNGGTGQFRIFAERTLDAIVDVSGFFAP